MDSFRQSILMQLPTDDLTQLFPDFVTPGIAGTGYGLRRKATDGLLYRAEIWPECGIGGTFELYDIAGNIYDENPAFPGRNNVNLGNKLTDAYLQNKLAKKEAKLIWQIGFNGDEGPASKIYATKILFTKGLACRFIRPPGASQIGPFTETAVININADGGFAIVECQL